MNEFLNHYQDERYLSPLTLLYNFLKSLPAYLISFYIIFFEGDNVEKIYLIISIALLFLMLPSIILNFLYFKFKITQSEIYIKTGIIAKKNRVIPLSKVQNISYSQNFLQKLLNIAKIQIETAGDMMSEAVLEFVSSKDAEEIIKTIKHYQIEQTNSLNKPIDKTDGEKILYKMNLKNVLVYGATRFRPLFLFFGFWLFSFIQQFQSISRIFNSNLESGIQNLKNLDPISLTFVILISILTIFFISWILEILWTLNTFYNFQLIEEKDKLITSKGLLNKNISSIPFKKIQQITIYTNIIKKLFGFYSLKIHTAGFGTQSKGNEVAVPNSTLEIIYEVIDKFKKYRIPENLYHISPKSIKRLFIKYSIILIIITIFLINISLYFLLTLLLIPFLYYFAFLEWKNRGYLFENNTIYIKYGVIIKKYNIIPLNKLQILHLKSSYFQRKLGLSTIILDTAAITLGAETIIRDIDSDVALELFNNIIENFNKNNKGIINDTRHNFNDN
jgi:putative membrane protein